MVTFDQYLKSYWVRCRYADSLWRRVIVYLMCLLSCGTYLCKGFVPACSGVFEELSWWLTFFLFFFFFFFFFVLFYEERKKERWLEAGRRKWKLPKIICAQSWIKFAILSYKIHIFHFARVYHEKQNLRYIISLW